MLPQLQRHAKKMGRNKEHTAIAASGCMRLSLRAAEVCRPCDERRLGDPAVAGEGGAVLCPPPACPSSSTVPAAPSRISGGSPLHVQSLCMRHLQAGEVTRILALNRAYIPARPEDFPCTHSLWCPFASSFLPPVGA